MGLPQSAMMDEGLSGLFAFLPEHAKFLEAVHDNVFVEPCVDGCLGELFDCDEFAARR